MMRMDWLGVGGIEESIERTHGMSGANYGGIVCKGIAKNFSCGKIGKSSRPQ